MKKWIVGAVAAVALTGCSSSDPGEPAAAPSPETTTSVVSTPAPYSKYTPPYISTSVAPVAPVGPTARDVVADIIAAGLPATGGGRGLTAQSGCDDLGCTQMYAVDEVSVYQFADLGSATKYAEAFGPEKTYQSGLIVIRYKRDGDTPIVESLIPEYQAVVDRAVG